MDKRDIRDLKRWYRQAAIRAKRAGFDIIYLYAAHWYLILQFLVPSNQRTDEYGGSLENRARLLKELIIQTKEVIGYIAAGGDKPAPTQIFVGVGYIYIPPFRMPKLREAFCIWVFT